MATPCDGFHECQNSEDEIFCEDGGLSTLILSVLAGGFVLVYVLLKIWRFMYNSYYIQKDIKEVSMTCRNLQDFFKDFEKHHDDKDVIEEININLIKILYDTKKKDRIEIFKCFFALVFRINDNSQTKTFLYLHKNINPILTDKILQAQYPGIMDRIIDFMESKLGKESITMFEDKISEKDNMSLLLTTFKTMIMMELTYIDIFKDLSLALSILVNVGGPQSILDFPQNFTSVMVIIFFATIFVPLWIATLNLAVNEPGLIFLQSKAKCSKLKLLTLRAGNFLLCLICPITLINACEIYKETLRKSAEQVKASETKKALKNYRNSQLQRAHFVRIDLGLEVYYQTLAQILLLLLAKTKTPTTGGLETMFDQKAKILGIELYPEQFLIISILWSFKSCIMTRLNSIRSEKVVFSFTSKVVVMLWSFFGALRRLLTMIAFFIPSFGFFSILYHWKAEEIPFTSRLKYAKKFGVSSSDKIELYGLNETVYWEELDRWNYTKPQNPTPPDYSIYTFLTLQETFIAFLGVMVLHIAVLLVAKCFTSQDFFNKKNKTSKLIHVLENKNSAFPYMDWDVCSSESSCSREHFEKRFRDVNIEMVVTFLINIVFSAAMLTPLLYTGMM